MSLRLSTLAMFNSIVLFSVATVLAVATWWGLKELRQPYQALEQYNTVAETFQKEVQTPINLYLESGDAVLLSEAEKGLQHATEVLELLPEDERVAIAKQIRTLGTFLSGDFRAAGKLSGDPLGLLYQNERETRDELSLLVSYGLEGFANNPDVAKQYIRKASSLLESVHRRALKREQFFASLNQEDLGQLQRINEDASREAQSFRDLPLLGVFDEPEQDFGLSLSDDEEESEDKGIERIDNVNYLIERYAGEIENTQRNVARVAESRSRLLDLIAGITSNIESAKQAIGDQVDEAFSLVRTILFSTIVVIIIFAVLIDYIQRSIIRRINSLVPFLEEYASGDFRRPVEVKALTEEVKSLAGSANRLRDYMSDLVADVQHRTLTVNNISDELAGLAQDVSGQSRSQSDETTKISVAIDQMSQSFHDVAESAAGAADAAGSAEKAVYEGNALVQASVHNVRELVADVRKTSESVQELSRESENIGAVLTVIETIAEQTNLLALNAAIEAARAGEQGRGFAVVADEVRSLSIRTSESTQEIKEIIERLQASARNTVLVMDKHTDVAKRAADETEVAGARLDQIVHDITHIKDLNGQIAATTEEQAAVASDINQNISHIKALSQQTSGSSESAELKAHELNEVCEALKHASEKFQIASS